MQIVLVRQILIRVEVSRVATEHIHGVLVHHCRMMVPVEARQDGNRFKIPPTLMQRFENI